MGIKIRLNETHLLELKDTIAVTKDATKIILPDTTKIPTKPSTTSTKEKKGKQVYTPPNEERLLKALNKN